jgi:hypothetical protein
VAQLTEEDVRDEEQADDDVVLDIGHAEVLDHALDLGVGDVCTVEVGHQVQDGQERDETPVNLYLETFPPVSLS